jgi:hypothetical protein
MGHKSLTSKRKREKEETAMTFSTDPVGGAYTDMSFFEPGGDVGDLAFAVAVYQLECYDAELEGNVNQIKIISELKKAYGERLQEVKDWLSKADADSDTVLIPADEATKAEYEWSSEECKIIDRSSEKICGDDPEYLLVRDDGTVLGKLLPGTTIDPETGKVDPPQVVVQCRIDGTSECIPVEDCPDVTIMVEVKKEVLDNEVSRLQGKLDDLGSDGEIQLLAINRALGRRSQALQLASNIMSTAHQSAMGIIQNIK